MLVDVDDLQRSLGENGFYRMGRLFDAQMCRTLIAQYADESRYRSRIVMERHGFGLGEYKYFADPLPPLVADLRTRMYPVLAAVANQWMEQMRSTMRYPGTLAEFLVRCANAGQTRPTPLILRYEAGGYNCLHQDLYGELAFPLQLVVMLSEPGEDYDGGEFVLVEQRPRMQSKANVIVAHRGEAIVFCTNERPVPGRAGFYRVKMRHGVSRVERGERFALGIIFHNAA